MRRLSNITITTYALFVGIGIMIASLATISFIYVLVQSIIKPFFLEKSSQPTTVLLDSSLDDVASFMRQRGGDLTVSSPSATLNKEANQPVGGEETSSSSGEKKP